MNLSPISKLLVKQSFMLGGSDTLYYKAIFCPGLRPDGRKCYNETDGSSWIECPVCKGHGVLYESPKSVRVTYTDNSNTFIRNPSGGFMKGEKMFAIPSTINPSVLKHRNEKTTRRVLRDKFEFLGACCDQDGKRKVVEVLYLLDDPKNIVLNNSVLYRTIRVGTNY